MRDYIATYPGIPVTIDNNGDITFHCGSIENIYGFAMSLPKLKIERKTYRCENCDKEFSAEIKYKKDKYDVEEWYVKCPHCGCEKWIRSYYYYR